MNKKQQAIKRIISFVKYNNKLKKELNEMDNFEKKINAVKKKYEGEIAK